MACGSDGMVEVVPLAVCTLAVAFGSASAFGDAAGKEEEGAVPVTLRLPPSRSNPRNSEGDFVRLSDGRIMFVYTHFTGGGSDHASAHLAARYSDDGGRTWTQRDRTVVQNEAGMNVMSVSLLRLDDGRIGLFYMRKNSLSDARPVMRTSDDEGRTWSAPELVIPDEQAGYYVLNNDRVVQLDGGRLIVPVARHNGPSFGEWSAHGRIMCYLSDDGGATWRRSESVRTGHRDNGDRVMLQEPGVVALKDGRLMMWARTDAGRQYVSYSDDRGLTWSSFEPSNIVSPRSPASIERIPSTGDLLLVWNNHRDVAPKLRGKRTPLNTAVSTDGGRTWKHVRTLADDPHGWYCYTAIHFTEDEQVLLGHCAGNRKENTGLERTRITRVPVGWLYSAPGE